MIYLIKKQGNQCTITQVSGYEFPLIIDSHSNDYPYNNGSCTLLNNFVNLAKSTIKGFMVVDNFKIYRGHDNATREIVKRSLMIH
ncbi:unnamed protein product [Cunninghamella echinulata]